MKKILALVLVAMLALTGSAMAAKVGVAMPTQDLQRWNQDGANMKAQLEAAGYEVILTYANNNVAQQVADIENMILNGCEALVVASIDGSALGTVLATAKEEGIPVIAYDRLLTDTDAVDYYATFDNYMVGTIQGTFLKEKFDLDNVTAEDPLTMEVFAGSPDDNNALYFYQGCWDVLSPCVEKGTIVVKSGQTDFQTCAILGWGTDDAQARLICYSDFAELCQNRAGVRAVAHAIGLNPISVIIPCHLVIPKEGIDKIREIHDRAQSTIFKGDDLCLDSILADTAIDFGEYALGKGLKRELIIHELTEKSI